jgi:4-diphosphocytidyl-2-C-methyl-D-erythritol kinase
LRLEILSPAKINLFLHVTGKRADGYHNIVSLMCCISLCDEITLQFGMKNNTVTCSHPHVPQNETNLAYRAALLFLDRLDANGERGGVSITINKYIPVAAGLGGGSSNAASVLLGLNHFYGRPFSINQLMSMGVLLGADVPFFLFQKPAIATGIGETLEAFGGLHPYKILLISPELSVSTAEIYRKLNLRLTNCIKKLTNTPLKKHGFDVALHLCNDLETVTASLHPEILSAKEHLLNHGAQGALMSGSGPAVFGLYADIEKARQAKVALSHKVDGRLFLADIMVDSGITMKET